MIKPMSKKFKFYIEEAFQGQRLDKFLAQEDIPISRSALKNLIKEEVIIVNGKTIKPSYRLKRGDLIEFSLPEEKGSEILAENIPLNIVYEDAYVMVINKPADMIVHPAPNVYKGTLVNALLNYTANLSTVNGSLRRGIVHRLDKDTTGLLVVAKDNASHLSLAGQLAERKMKRRYWALVKGRLKKEEGKIEIPIGRHPKERKKISVYTYKGKEAITFYKVMERFSDYTLLELRLGTGRTHQIRVHLSYLGHPIAGDKVYGGKRGKKETLINRPALHAYLLGFKHPVTGHSLEFSVPLPEDFQKSLDFLRHLRQTI